MSMATMWRGAQACIGGLKGPSYCSSPLWRLAPAAAHRSLRQGHRCSSRTAAACHHPGGSAPFSLLTYVKRCALIAAATRSRHAAVESGSADGRSSASIRSAMRKSRSCSAATPAPSKAIRATRLRRQWTEGWQLVRRTRRLAAGATCCRLKAAMCSASSSFRCRSIACASCAGSSSPGNPKCPPREHPRGHDAASRALDG